MNANGPTLAFSLPSRPRRKKSRMVAPTPPAMKKPAPSAPAATTGRCALSFPLTSVASPRPTRRSSTASASWSRSAAISRRTSSVVRVRLSVAAIGLQSLCREPRLRQRLLGDGWTALPDQLAADEGEQQAEEHQAAEDDQEGGPGRDDERECRS